MTKDRFLILCRWFQQHPKSHAALIWCEKLSVSLFYVSYFLLLALILLRQDASLGRALLVPAAVFLSGSLLRAKWNRPRPYEVWQIPPLIPKKTKGHGFPSRHTLSAAVITCAWFWYLPVMGQILLPFLLLVGLVRIMAGVHFVKDVLAGLIFGGGLGFVGFFLL